MITKTKQVAKSIPQKVDFQQKMALETKKIINNDKSLIQQEDTAIVKIYMHQHQITKVSSIKYQQI